MKTAAKIYVVAVAFLLQSLIQWLCFEYLHFNVLLDNFPACLVIFVAGLNLIMLYRFVYCPMPIWIQGIFVLSSVELTIIGAGHFVIAVPIVELTAGILSVLLLFTIFSLVGAYMIKVDAIHFVSLLCLWGFLCLISCVVLVGMLTNKYTVTYIHIFVWSASMAILFSISYDSRIINGSEEDGTLTILRYGLFVYGEFVLLLAILLHLLKQ